jgi:type IV pilus assembly protein PilA
MMVVVVIVGVLATLAVVGYRKLVQASHVSEATGMVQSIRVAQEAYHAETQQYANVSSALTSWYPQTSQYGVMAAWGAACGNCTTNMDWSQLPLHTDGQVLFGYATVAGTGNGGQVPALPSGIQGVTLQLPTTDWYVVTA